MITADHSHGSWPTFLGHPPSLKDLNFMVWGLLLVCFVLPFSIVVFSSHRPPDADFAGFYSLGRILNEHSPHDLYNYNLQKQICQEVQPRKAEYGPLPYPPFVALFFRPFTILPYWGAYTFWVAVSLVLYGIGLHFVIACFFPQKPLAWSLLFALAYCYFPFIANTAANGQLAAVGFCAIALALREENEGHGLRSGLVLSLCLYKPTILVLIVPMLLITRRFKALAGFALGTLALVLVTTAFEGFAVWPEFLQAIGSFGNSSVGVSRTSILPLAKYVDLTSFSANVRGGRSPLGIAVFLCCALFALAALIRFWAKSRACGSTYRTLLWAATLTWTLLLNVYVPVYDSILVVLSVLMTAGTLREFARPALRRWFAVTWILILICSWFSVPLSRSTGIQCMTVLFASLGIVQFMGLGHLAAQNKASLDTA